MNLQVPSTFRLEHELLNSELARAMKFQGRTAVAAVAVAQLMHPHFVKEEEYVLPPLSLLPELAQGQITPEMQPVTAMTNRLKVQLQAMRNEHRAIISALKDLADAAEKEGHPELVDFAQRLMEHAQMEEQITYPAAILVGEFIKLKLAKV